MTVNPKPILKFIFLALLPFQSLSAYADIPLPVTFSLDRSAPPSAPAVVFDKEGGPVGEGFVCDSSTDPTFGACDDHMNPDHAPHPGTTTIKTVFTEARTGAQAVVDLKAFRLVRTIVFPPWCPERDEPLLLNAATDATCGYFSHSVQVDLSLADTQNLPPYGGIWTAHVHLKSYLLDRVKWKYIYSRTYDVAIKLNMTDSGNIQMYLPNLSGSKPSVDLRLVADPFAKPDAVERGDATIESCLYDGYNSNSTQFTLTATDPNSDSGKFFVRSVQSSLKSNDEAGKIEYQVSASTPGESASPNVSFISGKARTFSISPNAPVRLVVLPNIAHSVACIPWTVHLHTITFKQKDKRPGHYSGTLQVLFSPSTEQ
jgi:hypothetical protein